MANGSDRPSTTLSRRRLLGQVALAAGGAAVLGTAATKRANASQVPQKLVGYQETPHGTQECDNCAQFLPPSACKVVEGTINPKGWCKVYVKKPA